MWTNIAIVLSLDLSRARFCRLEGINLCTEPLRIIIYDLALVSPDSLLLVNRNKTIQLVHNRTGSTLSEVPTWPHGPFRICLMGRERAAIAMSSKKVQLVHIRGCHLTLGTVLDVRAEPWVVTSSGDNIVVSYRRFPWLEVMSTDGRVLHQYKKARGAQTLKWPFFLTTSSDGFIYAADCRVGNNNQAWFVSSCSPNILRPTAGASIRPDTVK